MINRFYVMPRVGRVAYLNVAKSACSSILLALSAMRRGPDFEPPRYTLDDGSEAIHGFQDAVAPLEFFLQRWPEALAPLPAQLVRFSFVRNPYARVYSFYKSKILAGQRPGAYYEKLGIRRGCSFEQCIERLVEADYDQLEHHAAPQARLLFRGSDHLVDFLGHVEQADQDWPVVQALVGMDVPLEHRNVVAGESLDTVYSPELAALVYEYFHDDFALFGYEPLPSVDEGRSRLDSALLARLRKRQLPAGQIEALRESQAHSSALWRERAADFTREPSLRERFFAGDQETINELLLKRLVALEPARGAVSSLASPGAMQWEERLAALELQVHDQQLHHQDEVAEMRRLLDSLRRAFPDVDGDPLAEPEPWSARDFKQSVQAVTLTLFALARRSPACRLRRFLSLGFRTETGIIQRHGLLDPAAYFAANPSAADAGLPAAEHFVRLGAPAGIDPFPGFNTAAYISAHPELLRTGLNPLVHRWLMHDSAGESR